MSFTTEQAGSLYGQLVAGSDVEDGLVEQLQFWIDDYLNEVERQHDLEVGSIARPRSWVVSAEVEKFPEDQLPAVIVRSPGTIERPIADGQGRYIATWEIEVAVHIAAAPNRRALRLARLYALAVRGACLQQPAELFHRVDWTAERYAKLDSVDDRTICAAWVALKVQVEEAVNRNAGPIQGGPWPSDGGPESPEWPAAGDVAVEIIKTPIGEE
jgi:hypothetical protein